MDDQTIEQTEQLLSFYRGILDAVAHHATVHLDRGDINDRAMELRHASLDNDNTEEIEAFLNNAKREMFPWKFEEIKPSDA